jgi:NADH dehydrogenase
MEYVIIRPSWVYGAEDRSLNKFAAFVRLLPIVPVIGSGEERVQPVLVDDLARVVAAAVDRPESTNKIIEVGSREPISMNEILRTLMRVLGKERPLLHQPRWLVKIPAMVLQYLPNAPLSPSAIDFITQEEPVDPDQAERILGVRIRPLEEGLRTYLGRRATARR